MGCDRTMDTANSSANAVNASLTLRDTTSGIPLAIRASRPLRYTPTTTLVSCTSTA